MSIRLFLYLSFVVVVAFMVGFHLLASRLLIERVRERSPRSLLWLRPLLIGAIVFLDVPLVHVLLIYKFYNPPLLDRLMRGIATPFLLLHVNVVIFGGLALILRYVVRPIRSRLRRKQPDFMNSEGQIPMALSTDLTTVTEPLQKIPMALSTDLTTVTEPLQIDEPKKSSLLGRRRFIRGAALVATGYLASAKTISAMGSTHDYRIERVVMKVPGLPESFKGTSIAMLTDIHSSVFMTRELMERYVAQVMKLKPDMIFVTGDFVNSKLREVYPFAEAFVGLSAPMGVYGVTGNHDYYSGNIKAVAYEVEQCGIRLLRNENLALEKGGERIWLMGIDDDEIYQIKPYLATGKSTTGVIENMLHRIPDGEKKLFLCHKPYPFEEYSQLGIDAMFSGHTHGGQVVLAQLDNINLSFASLASKYIAGLYKSRTNPSSQLYVSRGIGTVGIPVRLNCPPEITQFVLV